MSAERRLTDTLAVLAGSVATLEPGEGAGGGDPAALATDVADWLVEQGMTFKQAHDAAGALVRRAEELGVTAAELDEDQRRKLADELAELPDDMWDAEAAVEKRTAGGGPARDSIADALRRARSALDLDR
jgi:argininosuccinate lyase